MTKEKSIVTDVSEEERQKDVCQHRDGRVFNVQTHSGTLRESRDQRKLSINTGRPPPISTYKTLVNKISHHCNAPYKTLLYYTIHFLHVLVLGLRTILIGCAMRI